MRFPFDKKKFLKVLAALYFLGFFLHALDLLDLRLESSKLTPFWKGWIIYLAVFDFLTAVFLTFKEKIGIVLFHLVALSQLYAYIIHQDYFGRQDSLVIFHVLSLVIYWKLIAKEKRASLSKEEKN